ncbi:hypothetical protein E4M02_06100 [Brevundimonas sp. S30B]|uniref:hypothetical protein n=2 Tax=unclassified Brevundimonas TaxID=2622653 RepID=UPI001071D7F7|nr:hypothetical protein [Brevundimonas sp. S30B]QBX38073.1 hypothetical protein E4M01_10040 [Brevundimonas sp. MF30-B]TFW02573.1 hypothetical protein E4M02_06100 [Brevundimonas sp. S30B]
MSRDIFKDGLAREIQSGSDYDAAVAAPGEVIQRGETIDEGKLGTRPKARKATPPPATDKKRKALEAEVETLDEEWGDAQAAFDARQAALADERDKAASAYRKSREALMQKIRGLR